jgi:hypothetical protein
LILAGRIAKKAMESKIDLSPAETNAIVNRMFPGLSSVLSASASAETAEETEL